MNGDVWKTLDWKNSELQGNYNSETDNIKIRHEKIIYIRDIWLSWYVVGINAKYNTIDALIKKMREETEGMQVIHGWCFLWWVYSCNISFIP